MWIHISPNPSLVSKPLQLPWNGHVYVLCNGQQKVGSHCCPIDLICDCDCMPILISDEFITDLSLQVCKGANQTGFGQGCDFA